MEENHTKKRTFIVEIEGPDDKAMNYKGIASTIHDALHHTLNEDIAWFYDKYVKINVTEE